MGIFTGLPDFGRPERAGVAEGYLAYDQPAILSVVPGSLSPQPLEVDQCLQERGTEIAQFALVTAGFTLDTAMDTTTRDDRTRLLARPAPLGAGLVRLTTPADLGVPATALAPQPCDAAAGAVLPTLIRLDGVAAELLIGALRAGLLTLGAVALVTVHGVATRCPGTLTVDVDTLLNSLGGGPLPAGGLADRARTGLPGITVSGVPDDDRLVAAAVLDRLVARLAAPAFVDETGAGWLFAPPGDAHRKLTWDLAEPVAAARLLRLSCDPVLGEGGGAVVRRITAPPLTDGHEQLVVHSTLPAMPAGVVAATVRLSAPPVPPHRPFEAVADVRLTPPRPTPATLELAPGEALAYDLRGSAALDTDRGPRTLTGPARRVTDDRTPVVTPADLGIRVIPVHATDDLLELADVTVTARATRLSRDPARFVSRAVPRSGAAGAWLALPRDAAEVTVEAVATTHDPEPRTVRQPLPDAAVWLDPFSFTDPPWRPGEPAEQVLVVTAAGLRAVGHKGGADWEFLPLTAGPARDAAGVPQLSILEAAGMAMLAVTTALNVSNAAQDAAREACRAAGAAGDVRLSPAPFEVAGPVRLLLRQGGQFQEIAAVRPSGTVTQDAALSATLTGGQLAAVHRSLAGEKDLLVVQYLLRVTATGPRALALTGGPDPVRVASDASTWRT
ncbi:hypothetical protein ACTOB_004106 [Actinoplanes oblitus]|uniref:Uncharacterized protein n=1 Tax=Actinoplanes oblitus TaxID=3040509 RepID=A0ABY8WR82_9ACTN|nr:hypothetical protein [Actinoplanes oblitus]WIN00402.1 hypothetical protein ACTOB_004106 [Actinoplanes oblitus]